MHKNVEVEIRGPLSKEQFKRLAKKFVAQGKVKNKKERVLIDYSTFLPGGIKNRTKDIRLRVTNGIPEVIVKIGTWGKNENRKELSLLAKPGEFDKMVEIFSVLGFTKGVLCIRKSQVFDYRGIEFALTEVPGHSYYYEAEKMIADNKDSKKVIDQIASVCHELGLKIYSQSEFFNYIKKLNKEANEIFHSKNHTPEYFKKRFHL